MRDIAALLTSLALLMFGLGILTGLIVKRAMAELGSQNQAAAIASVALGLIAAYAWIVCANYVARLWKELQAQRSEMERRWPHD